MKITFSEIEFDDVEIISFLKIKGYKIETHNTYAGSIDNTSWNSNKEYAIPENEVFDINKHKTINKTFDDLIKNGIKDFILSISIQTNRPTDK